MIEEKYFSSIQSRIDQCFDIFIIKTKIMDSWNSSTCVFNRSNFYKAWRIRQIQEAGTQKIEDSIQEEFKPW